MRIYLSGIEAAIDLKKAVRWGADAIGIRIGYDHDIHPEKARELFLQVPLFIARVGIFSNEKIYHLQELISFCHVNTVHFVGQEEPAQMAAVGEEMIKSCHVDDLPKLEAYPVQAVSLSLAEVSAAGELPLPEGKKLILSGNYSEKMWEKAVDRFQPYAAQIEYHQASRELIQRLRQL